MPNKMKYYAVIDTNVLVSYLLSHNNDSSVVKVMELVKDETIVPLIHPEIIKEYNDVLNRDKLQIDKASASEVLETIMKISIMCDRKESKEAFRDPDDIVFYEVSLSVDGSYLITGNLKHFPTNGHVVTPAEMLQIIHLAENQAHSICEPPIGFISR